MKFSITGLNHRTAPVELRERVAFDHRTMPKALKELTRSPGVLEALILSTCNRVELAVTAEDDCDLNASLERFLADSGKVEDLAQHLYYFEGFEAIRHVFRVAASLDSMVVGEPQILGQLKSAYAVAKTEGAVNGFLETVLTRAFSVAKRVRSETEIGQSAVSISFAAVELARDIFGSLKGKRVMIIGAGKMSELAARHLRRTGASEVFVTNRTQDRAEEMAKLFGGTTIAYDRFRSALHDVDIVITSSGAPHYLIHRDDMRRAIEARRNRPMFLIDIAVPRNIDPAVNEVDNVFLYDIDDLQRVVETNLKGRLKEAEHAEEIITEEVERLMERLKARDAAPMIVSLQEQLEQIRQGELDRIRGKLGSLTPQQEQAVEALTRGIINKIAHGPISEIRKSAGHPGGIHVMDIIRKVFRLENGDR